jgi:hypothetical protein
MQLTWESFKSESAKKISGLVFFLLLSFFVNAQSFLEVNNTNLPDLSFTKYLTADLDNDGFMDVVISGTSDTLVSQVYFNNGDYTFTASSETGFPNLYNPSLSRSPIELVEL